MSLNVNDFSRLDADRDGTSSRAEWRKGTSQQAQRGDQWVVVAITPVEQRIMENQRRESLFRALDSNGDGMISAGEAGLNAQFLNAFAQLDENRNGVVDRQEFASVHAEGNPQAQSGAPGEGAASSGGSASHSRPPRRRGD